MLRTSTPMPLTLRGLEQRLGNDQVKDYLQFSAARDIAFTRHEFEGKAIDTSNVFTLAAGGGATGFVPLAAPGGWIRGVTGPTAATSALQISIPAKNWQGAALAGMGVLLRASLIAELRIEAGFVDALPAVNTNVINSLTTPSFNTAVSGAVAVYDHTGSTTTTGLYTIGSAVAAARAVSAAGRPVANGMFAVFVEVNGQQATMWAGDRDSAVASVAAGLTAADGLIPFVSFKSSDANSKNIDIDAIFTWSGRLG